MGHETIKKLLEKYNVEPNKVLGQNFLNEPNAVHALIKTAEVSKEDTVIEVGPGTGAITKELAKKAGQVIAVEKDENMVEILKHEIRGFENIQIVEGDILKFEITKIQETQPDIARRSRGGQARNKQISNHNNQAKENPKGYDLKLDTYKLVGAPPYYLTARLFRTFLEQANLKPVSITVIIQKEVAEKICAKPPRMNLLAVSVQLYGEAKIIEKVPKEFFWPRPKVDSAILTVQNIKKPGVDETKFFKVLQAGFSAPRKQLAGNLSRVLSIERDKVEKILKECGIKPEQRAETLSVDDWKKLTLKF
ncbi:MAG: 16S rRNA (adenine(1518)-N(6)/adenine(1519)-N(6))-dimethyltransferase RsmA [Candidatus Spechtbacterales bacterium]